MRWGLLARGEDRGLGTMTWELFQNLHPDRTLLVDPMDKRFQVHASRFPGAQRIQFQGQRFPEAEVRTFLDGLDVVYSAETFYDWDLCRIAADMGVATVCHGMPEFYRHHRYPEWCQPTVWWWPTTWLLDVVPPGPVVPVPVPNVAPVRAAEPRDYAGLLRITHPAGHRAVGDRNGTLTLLTALRHSTAPTQTTFWSQDLLPRYHARSHQAVEFRTGGVGDRWAQYRDQQLMVLPRKYGGLCLPVLEALRAGVAVAMPDTPWNRDWPIIRLPLEQAPVQRLEVPVGWVDLALVDVRKAAQQIDLVARDRDLLASYQRAAELWADANTWDQLRPVYLERLASAARLTT